MSEIEQKDDPQDSSRRDFLGKACVGGFTVAASACVLGLARAVMPTVTPDPSAKFKIGPPEDYMDGSMVNFEKENVLVFRDASGFFAISTVCTHLGCIVAYDDKEGFACPCHGSKFDHIGKVTHGPAPSPLAWLEMSVLPSGQLAVDRSKQVSMGTKLAV